MSVPEEEPAEEEDSLDAELNAGILEQPNADIEHDSIDTTNPSQKEASGGPNVVGAASGDYSIQAASSNV